MPRHCAGHLSGKQVKTCGCEGKRLWWTGQDPIGRCLTCAIKHDSNAHLKMNLAKVVAFFEGDVEAADLFLRMVERPDEVSHETGA